MPWCGWEGWENVFLVKFRMSTSCSNTSMTTFVGHRLTPAHAELWRRSRNFRSTSHSFRHSSFASPAAPRDQHVSTKTPNVRAGLTTWQIQASAAITDAGTLVDPSRQAAAKAAIDLKERGWTSLEGILSPEECSQYVDDVWKWLESLNTGIDRYRAICLNKPHST